MGGGRSCRRRPMTRSRTGTSRSSSASSKPAAGERTPIPSASTAPCATSSARRRHLPGDRLWHRRPRRQAPQAGLDAGRGRPVGRNAAARPRPPRHGAGRCPTATHPERLAARRHRGDGPHRHARLVPASARRRNDGIVVRLVHANDPHATIEVTVDERQAFIEWLSAHEHLDVGDDSTERSWTTQLVDAVAALLPGEYEVQAATWAACWSRLALSMSPTQVCRVSSAPSARCCCRCRRSSRPGCGDGESPSVSSGLAICTTTTPPDALCRWWVDGSARLRRRLGHQRTGSGRSRRDRRAG